MTKNELAAEVDKIEMKPSTRAIPDNPDIPYVTHEGVLEINQAKLRCYKLNTGATVFDADDVEAFFNINHPAR